MSIIVKLTLSSDCVDTLTLPVAVITVRNNGADAVILPVEGDPGNLIIVEAQATGKQDIHTYDGLSHQRMMTTTRIDDRTTVSPLPSGNVRSWEMPLINYNHPLAVGDYKLRTAVISHTTGQDTYSDWRALKVMSVNINTVSLTRENAVLDVSNLLYETEHNIYLRQYNTSVPLAAWYSNCLPVLTSSYPRQLARKNYVNTASFDHCFTQTLVQYAPSTNVNSAVCERFIWGQSSPHKKTANLPSGCEWVHASIELEDGNILLFCIDRNKQELLCLKTLEQEADTLFSIDLPHFSMGDIHIIGNEQCLYIVYSASGIFSLHVSYTGEIKQSGWLLKESERLHTFTLDSVELLVKALYIDNENDQRLTLHAISLENSTCEKVVVEINNQAKEISFDFNRQSSQFCLLTHEEETEESESLRLYIHDQPPVTIPLTSIQQQYMPIVMFKKRIYIGFFLEATGFRFGLYSHTKGFQNPHG